MISTEHKTKPKEPALFWQTVTLYELVEFLLSFEGPEESGGLIIRRHAPIVSQIPGPVNPVRLDACSLELFSFIIFS